NWGRYEEICTLDTGLSSLCYNPVEGACFAIDHNKNFVRIEPDGFKSVISHIDFDFEPAYIGGLVYSPEDGLYYANVSTATESYILTITPLGAWDVYCELPGNNQLSFMFTTQEATTDTKRPEKPELKSFDFSKGAVSGSITYIMPSSLADGTPIDGTLTAVSLLDGVEYMTYEELPGETLKVDYENLESEMHYFGLYVVYEDRSSLLVMTTEYIGNDTPSAPADVHFENGLVTWSPVTDGIHDGYVDLDTLTYTVIINGVDYGTTAATELAVELPDAELAVYTASVYAEANGMKSAATVSNPVVHGHPFSLPMNIVPTADQAKLVTIIDGNQDGYFWYYDREYESFACDYSDEGVENDDWLIMPPFMADAESLNCILTFLVGNLNSEYPLERLEVYLGQTDKDGTIAMTQEIIAPFTPTEFVINGHQEVKAEFELPAPGTYYIGFHWISEPYQAGMEIKDICVKTNPNTGIQQTETLAHVTGKTGAVEITGCYGSHLRVRTVDGKTVLNTLITGDRISYPLEKGVYVISVDNRTTKAVIK
ncbi:MAG: choice-of-anchor J domain-containing protein, partial [Muribaculaceae bacterium]|nr:choice-of-anchor J domain-containing protein [Muribaculaceae bacterium]